MINLDQEKAIQSKLRRGRHDLHKLFLIPHRPYPQKAIEVLVDVRRRRRRINKTEILILKHRLETSLLG
jgi:hypothetical protein